MNSKVCPCQSVNFLKYVLGILASIFFCGTAAASVIFSATQTGEQLTLNPNVTFPGGSQTVSGSSLDLDPDASKQLLALWDILPAAGRGDLLVEIEVDYTALTGDNDMRVILTDGTNAFALVRSDNSSGRTGIGWGTTDGSVYTGSGSAGELLTGLGSVQPFAFSFFVSDDGLGDSFLASYEEGGNTLPSTELILGNFLNTDNQLSLAIGAGNSPSEAYRINSLSIQVSTIPVPGSIWLFALGVLAVSQIARSRVNAG